MMRIQNSATPMQDDEMQVSEFIGENTTSNDMTQGNEESKDKEEEKKQPQAKTGRWMPDEHDRFLQAMRIYGKDWDAIEEYVGTRDSTHCRSHA